MEIVHLGFGLVVVVSMSILIKRPLRGPGQKYGDYRAYTLCSKFGNFLVNIRVVVAREAYPLVR
jgi:hypothetical protein